MVAAIIVAAGSGARMGEGTDKLFLELAGRPVVGHAWARFDGLPEIDEIVLVVRDGRQSEFEELGAALSVAKPHRIVEGGAERQDSVWNGLMAVSSGVDIVAIQDGARPCTDAGLIVRTIDAARKTGAAVAAGFHPLMLMLPATLSASFAFMLPVATPPNAIVFGSGWVTIPAMSRAGFALNFIGAILITTLTLLLIQTFFL